MYRSDIDGLRALAVLIVIGFHGFPKQVPGGFVGVDVFFVISGFLISGIIYDALKAENFSFIDFYARRARRIFPALIVVLVACAMVGWFVMLQGEYRMFGRHAAAAAAFIANFAFFQDSGYFGPAAELLPLLHLWSLGIEEQYYLIWPLLIVLSWRLRYGPIAVAAIVFVVSFASNVMLVRTDATAAFYLPLPRFWELMLGSALAFLTLQGTGRAQLTPALREVASWGGLLLILAALFLINRDRPFPGWWALLPTFGTALLIVAGPGASFNRLVLSRPWVVHIGLISYPLYLWHWPILVFERLVRINAPTDLMKGLGIAAALLLADQTYRWIEKPVRFGGSLRPKALAAASVLAVTGCLGLLVYLNDGFPQRLPEDVRALGRELGMGSSAITAARTDKCFLTTDGSPMFTDACDANPAMPRKVVLWGDSYAAHLYFGLHMLEQARRDFALAQFTAAACPPIFGFVSERRHDCEAINNVVAQELAQSTPDTVILAGRWEVYDGHQGWNEVTADMIHATVTKLAAMGVRRVVVVGQFPVWQVDVPRLRVARFRSAPARVASAADANRTFPERFNFELERNAMVQDSLVGTSAIFISALATFCNDQGCLLVVPGRDEFISPDTGHLTLAASQFFATANATALLGE